MKNKLKSLLLVILIGLVVTLLIGLIALSSGGARCGAKDARVMADLLQVKKEAEKFYLEDNTYKNINCNFGNIKILCDDIKSQSRNPVVIHTSRDNYCAYANLPVKHGYSCIGSDLKSIQTYINPGGAGYCDGETFICPKEEGFSLYEKIIEYFPLILILVSVIGIVLVFSISRGKNWRKQKIVRLIIILLISVIVVTIIILVYSGTVRC